MECYEEGPGMTKPVCKAGDIISGIDGTDITEKDVSEVVDMIRGSGKEKCGADRSQTECGECHGGDCGDHRCGAPLCIQ